MGQLLRGIFILRLSHSIFKSICPKKTCQMTQSKTEHCDLTEKNIIFAGFLKDGDCDGCGGAGDGQSFVINFVNAQVLFQ